MLNCLLSALACKADSRKGGTHDGDKILGLSGSFGTVFGHQLPLDRVHGMPHHESHAIGVHPLRTEPALVVIMDGHGEVESISIFEGRGAGLRLIHTYPRSASLGHFYTSLTQLLGYGDFDQ